MKRAILASSWVIYRSSQINLVEAMVNESDSSSQALGICWIVWKMFGLHCLWLWLCNSRSVRQDFNVLKHQSLCVHTIIYAYCVLNDKVIISKPVSRFNTDLCRKWTPLQVQSTPQWHQYLLLLSGYPQPSELHLDKQRSSSLYLNTTLFLKSHFGVKNANNTVQTDFWK